MSKRVNRIDVFTELTKPTGTFDYNICEKLLGDNYDNFIHFCEAIDLIPEEISTMKVVSFPESGVGDATFQLELMDGQKITLEK